LTGQVEIRFVPTLQARNPCIGDSRPQFLDHQFTAVEAETSMSNHLSPLPHAASAWCDPIPGIELAFSRVQLKLYGSDPRPSASKTGQVMGQFREWKPVRPTASTGFMERAMGIEPMSEVWDGLVPLLSVDAMVVFLKRRTRQHQMSVR
jgi:hypothetical protein